MTITSKDIKEVLEKHDIGKEDVKLLEQSLKKKNEQILSSVLKDIEKIDEEFERQKEKYDADRKKAKINAIEKEVKKISSFFGIELVKTKSNDNDNEEKGS